ncbi:replication initiator protein [Microviridae sp.]|nr:replication initiator protein [Microviridae sp.]
MHEAQMHDDCQFITLTYNDESIPYDGSLTKPHFQKFMKRYRKSVLSPIRYFMCGEYGDLFSRPHYHACIFGHDFTDKEIFSEKEGILTYYSKNLEDLWGKGFCTTSELTLESAAYVARYTLKKIKGEKSDEHYQRICPITGEIRQIEPEYANMSRRPGIALEWYKKFHTDIFPYDTTIYKGKRIKTPRYYENLLRSQDQSEFDGIKASRKENALANAHDNTPERLLVKETVKLASIHNLRRTLHET